MESREHQAITIDRANRLIGSTNEIDESTNEATVAVMQRRLEGIRREGIRSTRNSDMVSIYRAPQRLAEISPRAIKPEIVSIGPYHRGKPEFGEFESHKWQFLDCFLSRPEHNCVKLHNLMRIMESLENDARGCYSDPIEMSSEDFTEMMALDGCFIVELLRQVCGGEDDPVNANSSSIITMPWLIPILIRDLLKLENQLPFAVLQTLFDLSMGSSSEPLWLLALKFFNLALPRSFEIVKEAEHIEGSHLLHLFHRSYCYFEGRGSLFRHRPLSAQSMPCVTLLRPTGIKFRPRRSTDNFLDISFRNGVLEIPPIAVNDFTDIAFINCVAFEQCHHPYLGAVFSAYIAFMSCLVNSARDVTFLRGDGIITNFSHVDHRVAWLFRELGKNVVFNIRECYLSKQFGEVEAYYYSNWATLKRTYFSSPRSLISVVSASVLLAFSGIQTIMAILSYKVHHS